MFTNFTKRRLYPAGRFSILTALLAVLTCICISCGGGGGSTGPATALELPDRIDLSSVEEEGTAYSGYETGLSGFDDEGTDYSLQAKQSWVDDTDALNMVNDILAIVKDTAYESFLNAGPYKALVKEVDDSEQSQGGATAGSSTVETLMEITVDVSRRSNSHPMVVKVWVIEEDGPGGANMLIRGYFEVTRGVSGDYPLGALTAHFKGSALDSNGDELPGDPVFTMAMQVSATNGNVTVQLVDAGEEDEGGFTFEWDNQVRVEANDDLTEGNAYVYCAETDWNTHQLVEETFYFAYNTDYFKYQEVGEIDVEVEDKNDLSHRIFRYKLFETDTGDAITRSSGFPLRFEGGEYGYVGYWGLWTPYGVEVEHGDTVTRADNDETYTLFKKRGKLTKHTRSQVILGDLVDVELGVWDDGDDIIVAWNGTGFFKLGTRNWETGTIEYLETPVSYTFDNEWDGGWCESLSAWLCLGGLTPTNSDVVYYHAEQTVTPAMASDQSLYYWGFALDVPITQTVIDNAATALTAYFSGSPTEKTYFFDSANMILKTTDVNGDPVTIGADIDLSGSVYEWGYWMSPMTTNGGYDENTCWDIYNETVYYSWSTGLDEWNHFTTLVDGDGGFVSFDAPLKLTYTHLTANDINDDSTYNGKKFSLDYDGYELHIPWEYNDTLGEWEPLFNLKDGIELTDADDPGITYVVKGTEECLIMNEVTDSGILTALETTLPIDTSIDPPDLTYDATKTALVGEVPADAVLKVIKGEVIE